jgi:hypothetical protein
MVFHIFPGDARIVVTTDKRTVRVASGSRIWVEPGTVTMQAMARGHMSVGESLNLSSGETRQVRFSLIPEGPSASIALHTKPDGGEVFIDGVSMGNAPLKPIRIEAGSHWISARLSQNPSEAKRVRLEPESATEFTLSIQGVPVARALARMSGVASMSTARTISREELVDEPDDVESRVDSSNSTPLAGVHLSDLARVDVNIPDSPLVDDMGMDDSDIGDYRPSRPGSGWRTAGWILMGTGVAILAGGGVLNYLASKEVTTANALDPAKPGYSISYDYYADRAKMFGKYTFISYAAGGATAAGGLLMILLAPKATSPTSIQLRPLPGGLLIQGGATF